MRSNLIRVYSPRSETSERLPALEKTIAILLSVSGLVYGFGLVAANSLFSTWGFYDFDLSHQQCIVTGTWFLAFSSLVLLVGFGFLHLFVRPPPDLFKSRPKWLSRVILLPLVFLGIYSLWQLVSFPWPGPGVQTNEFKLGDKLIFIFGSMGCGVLSYGLMRETRNGNTLAAKIACSAGICLSSFLLIVLFGYVLLRMPVALGGARPEELTLSLSPDAREFLQEAHLPFTETKTSKFLRLNKVWIFHEHGAQTIIWSSEKPQGIFQIPTSWIQTREWALSPSRSNGK